MFSTRFITIILMLLLLNNYSHAQENKHRLVNAISQLETILKSAFEDSSADVFISMNGIIEELDTTLGYKMIFDLRDIDLTEMQQVVLSENNEAALLLSCKQHTNCVKLEKINSKAMYYNQLQAFTVPIKKESKLQEIYLQLVKIQEVLPR